MTPQQAIEKLKEIKTAAQGNAGDILVGFEGNDSGTQRCSHHEVMSSRVFSEVVECLERYVAKHGD